MYLIGIEGVVANRNATELAKLNSQLPNSTLKNFIVFYSNLQVTIFGRSRK